MAGANFLEIEYKFLLPNEEALQAHCERLRAMNPSKHIQVKTTDTYYRSTKVKDFVYRHRFDAELQQLTVKSLTVDPSVRTEINLNLVAEGANQGEAVTAFLNTLGVEKVASLRKDLNVFYFPNMEVALYVASTEKEQVICLEVEATDMADITAAKTHLDKWCEKLGVKTSTREMRSLYEILLKSSVT